MTSSSRSGSERSPPARRSPVRPRGTATRRKPSATPAFAPSTTAYGWRSSSPSSPISTCDDDARPSLPPTSRKVSAMKIALDPYMFRSTPLLELPGLVADLGFEYIELSPREDFTPFFLHPRVDDGTVRAFKKALDVAGVQIASHLPLYRWSGPDEDER